MSGARLICKMLWQAKVLKRCPTDRLAKNRERERERERKKKLVTSVRSVHIIACVCLTSATGSALRLRWWDEVSALQVKMRLTSHLHVAVHKVEQNLEPVIVRRIRKTV